MPNPPTHPGPETLGPDLLAAWETVVRTGHGSLSAAVAVLSERSGHNYSINLIARWRRGEAPIPEPAQRLMREAVLEALELSHVAPVMEPARYPP